MWPKDSYGLVSKNNIVFLFSINFIEHHIYFLSSSTWQLRHNSILTEFFVLISKELFLVSFVNDFLFIKNLKYCKNYNGHLKAQQK